MAALSVRDPCRGPYCEWPERSLMKFHSLSRGEESCRGFGEPELLLIGPISKGNAETVGSSKQVEGRNEIGYPASRFLDPF